MQAVAHRP